MPVYQVTPLADPPHIADVRGRIQVVIATKIPEWDRFSLQGDVGWLVRFPGTAVELSNLLGLTSPPAPPVPYPVPPAPNLGLGANALAPPVPPAPTPNELGSSGLLFSLGATTVYPPPPPPPAAALILAVSTYYGFGPTDMWQWLQRSYSAS